MPNRDNWIMPYPDRILGGDEQAGADGVAIPAIQHPLASRGWARKARRWAAWLLGDVALGRWTRKRVKRSTERPRRDCSGRNPRSGRLGLLSTIEQHPPQSTGRMSVYALYVSTCLEGFWRFRCSQTRRCS